MELLIIWVFFALIVGLLSSSTTLGFWGGFLLSVILSPLIGFIIYLFYPSTASRDRQNKLLQQAIQSNNRPQQISTADEIEKLKNLLDKGAITQIEYDQQKARLLS